MSPQSGLRTLCIAMTELEPEEFQRWSDIYYKASTSLENREKNVDDAAELIEKVSRLSINTESLTSRETVSFVSPRTKLSVSPLNVPLAAVSRCTT